ncbi:MAG: ribosome small subunit-dependent GTPase A [Sarcina sp.]
MNKSKLINLGLDDRILEESKLYSEKLYLGRVSIQQKGLYNVITEDGEIRAEVSGKFKFESISSEDFPAVGDWVLVDRKSDEEGNGIIHHRLTRKTVFKRKVSGNGSESQVVGSNIDTIFLCMALNNDFNLRRLERYIIAAYDSFSNPVIILTKSDLCFNLEEKLVEVQNIGIGLDIIVTSSILDEGIESLGKYIKKGETVAFIGSSGIGKSTLINKILGEDRLKTNNISENDKGRHTTTYRQMILLKEGGVLIDTPGMRELGVVDGNIEKGFNDIEELSLNCKFSNCTHTKEKGCAILEAIEEGSLSEERFKNYKKLEREVIYNSLKSSKRVEEQKIISMFGSKKNMKNMTRHIKNKNKY